MIANFHTHTPRCHHAVGTEEEYVRCALDAGMEILGFADHTPCLFPEDFRSTFRMLPEELPGYVAAVRDVKDRYRDHLEIRLGVEAEFYPRYFRDTVQMLRDHGIEYMLLGQHMLYNEVEGVGVAEPTTDVAMLRQYCDQTIEAMYTGLFTCFAHPDVMRFVGENAVYHRHMGRLCRAAKACAVPLEINLLGLARQRHYPCHRFWEIAAEEGCQVVLGVDAHRPEALLDTATERNARRLAMELGLEVLEIPSLVHI